MHQYSETISDVYESATKSGVFLGIISAFYFQVTFGMVGLGFWYSSTIKESIGTDKLLMVFFAVLMSSMAVGQLPGPIGEIFKAKAAAYNVYEIIDRIPDIDIYNENSIEFQNVKFTYPTRPDSLILNDISFKVPPGHTVALIGPTGCVKIACASFVQRY